MLSLLLGLLWAETESPTLGREGWLCLLPERHDWVPRAGRYKAQWALSNFLFFQRGMTVRVKNYSLCLWPSFPYFCITSYFIFYPHSFCSKKPQTLAKKPEEVKPKSKPFYRDFNGIGKLFKYLNMGENVCHLTK